MAELTDLSEKEANVTFFRSLLKDRALCHPALPQEVHTPTQSSSTSSTSFRFVIGADSQLGMASHSEEWQTELEYCKKAISYLNAMDPKPEFFCMCGDLVDMHPDLFPSIGTPESRLHTQMQQYYDFQEVWRMLDPTIPLVCICGNHDVGNQPTRESIERYSSLFGDDYFTFWCHECYFICLNSNIYFDNTQVKDLYAEQHAWLESRLQYGRSVNARRIFICGHHPWFLYNEDEVPSELRGVCSFIARGEEQRVSDAYFSVPLETRQQVLSLCKRYQVDACFAGHYHQNLITKTTWGMPIIVTGAICNVLLKSDAKDYSILENHTPGAGVRVVTIDDTATPEGFSHSYETI